MGVLAARCEALAVMPCSLIHLICLHNPAARHACCRACYQDRGYIRTVVVTDDDESVAVLHINQIETFQLYGHGHLYLLARCQAGMPAFCQMVRHELSRLFPGLFWCHVSCHHDEGKGD